MAIIGPVSPIVGGARGDGEATLRSQVIAILAELNGNLNSANILSLDGSKLVAASVPGSALAASAGAPVITELSGAASVTFASLVGDTDDLYIIELVGQLTQGGTARQILLRPNNDTVAVNYGNNSMMAATPAGGAFWNAFTGKTGIVIGSLIDSVGNPLSTANFSINSRTSFHADQAFSSRTGAGTFSAPGAVFEQTGGNWIGGVPITSLVVDFGGGTFTGLAILRRGRIT